MHWYFFELPILCIVTALVDLDAYHLGQWMVSRPIVLGPLLGACFGKLGIGVWVGGTLELLTLDDLPIGHWIPLNTVVATASTLILCIGRFNIALPIAFATGIVLSLIFRKAEVAIRSKRRELGRKAEAAVERREGISGSLIAQGIGAHFAVVASYLYITIVAAGLALVSGWRFLPQEIRAGFDFALDAAPWLGIATLIHVFRPR